MIDRRSFLDTAGIAAGVALAPRMAFSATATKRRFVFIIRRGAADGLGIVAPTGDPALAEARGDLAANSVPRPVSMRCSRYTRRW